MKYLFLITAIPLVLANVIVNVSFWAGHVDTWFAKSVSAMWGLGLTGVEFLFPVWAIRNRNRMASIFYAAVGFLIASFSIWVFAMTIDNAIAKPFHDLLVQENMSRKIAHENTLKEEIYKARIKAANITLDAATRFNELDKISHGTLPAIEKFEAISNQIKNEGVSMDDYKPVKLLNGLNYLVTLSKVIGVDKATLKLYVGLFLALLIEAAAIMSIIAWMEPKISRKPVSVDENNIIDKTSELSPLQKVRKDILDGVHGEIPALAKFQKFYQGSGLRFDDFQKLRDEMIETGELERYGKNRVKVAIKEGAL